MTEEHSESSSGDEILARYQQGFSQKVKRAHVE